METIDIEIEKEKAKTFKKYSTYVFIQTKEYGYNGYIVEVNEDDFIFMDDKIPAPFPIPFITLTKSICPSRKEARKYD